MDEVSICLNDALINVQHAIEEATHDNATVVNVAIEQAIKDLQKALDKLIV